MVARRSPQTERIIGLINYLSVDETNGGITLSELARRLGVSMATCYPMLEALTDAGFLTRHPARKTFHLGPALVTVGAAAAKRDPRQAMAREAMIQLGTQLNLTCWLYSVDETHLRVIDQAWHSRVVTPIMRVGERYPSRPPVGAVLMAWASERRIDHWLDRVSLRDEDRRDYRARLAEIRREGYAVCLEETPIEELRTLVTELSNAATPGERSRLAARLRAEPTLGSNSVMTQADPGRRYSVQSIEAPIFDESGRAVLALGVTNLPLMDGSRINELAKYVRDAVTRLSAN